jgi:hypothetical protein
VQNSGQSNRAGKLKNWKSDILIGHPVRQDFRISGFQIFRFSLAPRCTSRAGEEGTILNDGFRGRSCPSRDTENIADAVFLLGDYRQYKTFSTYKNGNPKAARIK